MACWGACVTPRRLYSWQQAHQVLREAAEWLKPRMLAGHQYALMIGEPPRSSEQNRLLHALLTDIARQVEWAGKKRHVDTWRRLVTAAWLRAEHEQVEMLPAIDGHGVDIIFERTSRMTRAQLSSLIDYVTMWGDSKGVEWRNRSEHEQGHAKPPCVARSIK